MPVAAYTSWAALRHDIPTTASSTHATRDQRGLRSAFGVQGLVRARICYMAHVDRFVRFLPCLVSIDALNVCFRSTVRVEEMQYPTQGYQHWQHSHMVRQSPRSALGQARRLGSGQVLCGQGRRQERYSWGVAVAICEFAHACDTDPY